MIHSFAIIDSIEPKLKMRWIVNDALKKLLEKDSNAVKHEVVEDRVILTASSAELQAFVLKYADDCNVFSAEVILSRSVLKTPSGPNDVDANAVAAP